MVADILRESLPEIKDKVPVGKPGTGLGAKVYGVDATKAEAILGIKFRKLEDVVKTVRHSHSIGKTSSIIIVGSIVKIASILCLRLTEGKLVSARGSKGRA